MGRLYTRRHQFPLRVVKPRAEPCDSLAFAERCSRLPLEIVGFIIVETAKLQYGKRNVAPFCLISKASLPGVRRELYRSVSMSYRYWDVDSREELLEEDFQGLVMNDAAFLRTLKEAPDLGALVRGLTLDLQFYEYLLPEEGTDEIRSSVQTIFGACANISQLEVRTTGDGCPTDYIAETIAELETTPPLEELDITCFGTEIDGLLGRLPKLRNLHLRAHFKLWAMGHRFPSPPPFPFSLKELKYDIESPGVFQAIMHNSHSTLRTLNTTSSLFLDKEVRTALPSFNALKALDVKMYITDHKHSKRTAFAISSLPSLQTLSVHSSPGPSGAPLVDLLIPRLPSSLQTLDLAHIPVDSTSINRFIDRDHATPLPNLRLVRIDSEGWASRKATQKAEKERVQRELALERCEIAGLEVEVGRRY